MQPFLLILKSHFLLSVPLILPPIINLFALFFYTSHTKKLHILAIIAPAYYSLLAASIFSGLVVWAMLGFIFNIYVLLMLLCWLISFSLEIFRHIKQKRIIKQGADIKTRERFFFFAKVKYLFDFSAFTMLFLWKFL